MVERSKPTEVRVGVVGVGHLGSEHARVYSDMTGVDLVGVVDTDERRGREVAEREGTAFFGEYRELLGEADAVSVVTPTEQHYQITREFLEMGVPVLVEKPMTRSLEEARELVEVANRSSAALQVGHVERFNPAVQAMQKHVDMPKYIESVRISPYSFRSTDISVVLDLMIHDIDIILSLSKSPLKEVNAVGVKVISETEDMANARLVFGNGCVANVTASRVSTKTVRQIRVFQKECYISLDYIEQKASIYRRPAGVGRNGAELGKQLNGVLNGCDPRGWGEMISCEQLELRNGEPLRKELESFVDAVRSGTRPIVAGEDGLRAMEAADMIVKAIQENGWDEGK